MMPANTSTAFTVKVFTPELTADLEPLYTDFMPKAVDVYHWHQEPKTFPEFLLACLANASGATLVYQNDVPVGFWLYVFPGHGALEVCAFYLKDDVKAEKEWIQHVVKASFAEWFTLPNWSDFSFGIYGREVETLAPFIEGLEVGNDKALTLADQHIMQRPILFDDTPDILKRLATAPFPYEIRGWKPKYQAAIAETLALAFHQEPDAQWDNRFKDVEGANRLLAQMLNKEFGHMHNELSLVVLDETRRPIPIGAAFVLQPEAATVNIPLLFVHPEHRGKGLAKLALLNVLQGLMLAKQRKQITATFVNATTNPAQFSAYHLYEELGFTLFDKGYHAYFKDND
jgi:GNAT superfamily N-acetyltransferase